MAWIVPAHLLDEAALASRSSIGRLDIDREKRRYGASTLGGVGISALRRLRVTRAAPGSQNRAGCATR